MKEPTLKDVYPLYKGVNLTAVGKKMGFWPLPVFHRLKRLKLNYFRKMLRVEKLIRPYTHEEMKYDFDMYDFIHIEKKEKRRHFREYTIPKIIRFIKKTTCENRVYLGINGHVRNKSAIYKVILNTIFKELNM